jgi:glycolate oxidase FAD binding subunit
VALGVAFVTGEGRLVRGGGRVVKNVAGFDLVRLVIGAWGTLGVLTEVTVRLRALPEADVTVALPIPSDAAALATMLATLRDAPIAPLALQLTVEGGGRLLARLAGNEDSVRAQREAISRLAPVEDADALAWTRLAQEHERFNVILRLSRRPTELARLWCMATGLAARFGGDVSATVGRGVVRCRLMVPDEASGELRAALDQRDPGDTVVVEVMPPAWWSFAPPSAVADPLSRSLRAAFDPAGVLNPGIIGAGA